MLPLEEVVALVVSRPLGPIDTKQVLTGQLERLGAKVASRLSKDVTHVIFQHQRTSDAEQLAAQDHSLRELYEKSSKVSQRKSIVASVA